MTPLAQALAELAEPHLRRLYDAVEPIARSARFDLAPAFGTGPSAASAYRGTAEEAAGVAVAALDQGVATEVERLRALSITLDWLADAPPERSLSAALVGQTGPPGLRVAELLGLLGVARVEAALVAREPPPPVEVGRAVQALVRARLGRIELRIHQWLEALS